MYKEKEPFMCVQLIQALSEQDRIQKKGDRETSVSYAEVVKKNYETLL